MTAVTWWLRAATENRVILSVGEAGDEESVLFRNVQRHVRLQAGVVTGTCEKTGRTVATERQIGI